MTDPGKSTNVRTRSTPASIAALRVGLRAISRPAPELAATIAMRVFTTARRHPRPAWEQSVLGGATPFSVSLGDGQVAAWSFGDSTGPTVLLVHGWEGRGSQLGAFVPAFVARGFRVVMFDAPGHGASTLARASLVDHANAMRAVADRVGRLHAVVAHSMGGAAALLATRFGLVARRFVLVAPPSSPNGYVRAFRQTLGLTPEIESRMVARLESELRVPFASLDATVDAARLDAPLLVVHDEEDREVPVAEGRRIAAAARNARFSATRGLGHRRILKDPALVERVAAFVSDEDAFESVARLAPAKTFEATLEGELYFRDARWR